MDNFYVKRLSETDAKCEECQEEALILVKIQELSAHFCYRHGREFALKIFESLEP